IRGSKWRYNEIIELATGGIKRHMIAQFGVIIWIPKRKQWPALIIDIFQKQSVAGKLAMGLVAVVKLSDNFRPKQIQMVHVIFDGLGGESRVNQGSDKDCK